ncbi:MAG TPA: hypothetical protein VKB12_09260 [Pyrinomonadaceae bacterium]|nr:hypothetical protein [Pyrinomonadaceae bacterium]
MKEHARRPTIYARAALAAASVVILLTPSALSAQTSIREREAKRQEMQMRQWALRNIEKLKNAPPERSPDTRPAYEVVEQDFEQMQLVNHTLAGAAQGGAALDYELIKKHSGEVRKRASRLKSYLVLPEVEGQSAQLKVLQTQTPEAMRSAVASLDALVNAFAWNPIFRQPNVIDLEQSSKAARDLAGIISVSERISKGAAEMSKIAKREAKK